MPLRPPICLLLALGSIAVGAIGCGGDDDGDGKSNKAGGTSGASGAQEADAARCELAEEPRPRQVRRQRPDISELSRNKTYAAVVDTTCGTFEIELDAKQAPKTGGAFAARARKGFYDDTPIHRIVTGFVIQGGDPTGTGGGGPGYTTREKPPDDVVYSEGVVAMAKSDVQPPGTAGSQFFVVTTDDAALEPDYALLGKVTKGMDVVRSIELVPAGPDERPVDPVVIKKIRIKTR